MPTATPAHKPLPAWLLGLANLPLGLTGGLALLTVPQWLAAQHVAEPIIAELTTVALLPTFLVFLIGPLFDIWFSRRTYAIGSTLLATAGALGALLAGSNHALLGAAMFCALLGASANFMAIGGWFGTTVDARDDATLGAWMNIANAAGFGVFVFVGIGVIRALPMPYAALVLAAPNLLPLFIYFRMRAPPPDSRLASESFGAFFRDLGALIKQPVVLQTLLLFGLPAASFALTNTLGGLGGDYKASEGFVSTVGGVANVAAGLVGSLLIPLLARRAPGRALYITIGFVGAFFTLSLIVAPHTPALFAIALAGEDVVQAAALAMVNVIALQSLGKNNPFAATQFGLLICASSLPITYMQYLDGHAYGRGGLTSMYLTDALLGIVACVVMTAMFTLPATVRRNLPPDAE
jgi:PAT family beta-lactamase induction signal transducer AmpG